LNSTGRACFTGMTLDLVESTSLIYFLISHMAVT
jgi:hypothetical protein